VVSLGLKIAVVLQTVFLVVLGAAFLHQGLLTLTGGGTIAGVLGTHIRPTGANRYLFAGSLLLVGIASILFVCCRILYLMLGRETRVGKWMALSVVVLLLLGSFLVVVYFCLRAF
jgi:hypothetical protein